MKTASMGSISHGTLRDDDLLEAFASTLHDLIQINAEEWCSDEGRKERDVLLQLIAEAQELIEEEGVDNEKSEVIETLGDALNEFAPPYCYFGTNEGDGSDFGFWPSMENIEELPRVEDGDEAKALGEDAAFINDHGNVTVYGGDGSIILELI